MISPLPIPKYHRIYLLLKEQLGDGRYDAGMPGEIHLARQFKVARVTMRRALQELADEGLLVRSRGRVTRRAAPTAGAFRDATETSINGLLGNLVTATLNTTVRVLECGDIPAPDQIALALKLPRGSPVQKLVRVRSTPQGPVSFLTTYMPQSVAAKIAVDDFRTEPVMVLLEKSGVRVGWANARLGARLADPLVAPWLDVDIGSALLTVNRIVFTEHDDAVLLVHGQYRPDRYEYLLRLSARGEVEGEVRVQPASGAS